ncbi:MAG: MATE family efflux transporter [Actinomycetota bacterium]|nr:MATE family efflux transporter [Actinomycetota bacterium]
MRRSLPLPATDPEDTIRVPATWPALISLAWPAVATGMVRIAMRTVDLIVVGLVVGASGVAAVGVADTAARLVLMAALGLSAGTVATVSQRYGAGAHDAAADAATQTALLAVTLGALATVGGLLGAGPFFRLLGAGPDVAGPGTAYLRIVLATAIPRVLAIMLARVLQAAGDTRTPMAVRVTATVVNIALTVTLVGGPGPFPALGVVGAAVGTAVGNILGGTALAVVLCSGRARVRLHRAGLRATNVGRRIVRIGAPQVAERTLYALAEIPLNALTLAFGTAANAGFHVGRRVHLFARVPAIGVGVAASALVGTNLGRRDAVAAQRYGDGAVGLAAVVGLVGAAVLIAAAGPIATAFGGGGDPQVHTVMASWVRTYGVATVFLAVYEALRSTMQAAGETRLPLAASAVGIAAFLLGASALMALVLGWGAVGVQAGVVLDAVVRPALLGRWWRSGRWLRHAEHDAAAAPVTAVTGGRDRSTPPTTGGR